MDRETGQAGAAELAADLRHSERRAQRVEEIPPENFRFTRGIPLSQFYSRRPRARSTQIHHKDTGSALGVALHGFPECLRVRQVVEEAGGENDIVRLGRQFQVGNLPLDEPDPRVSRSLLKHGGGTIHRMKPVSRIGPGETAGDIARAAAEVEYAGVPGPVRKKLSEELWVPAVCGLKIRRGIRRRLLRIHHQLGFRDALQMGPVR